MALGVDASTIHAAWAVGVKVILSFPGGEAVVDIWSGWSYGRTTCKDVRDLSSKVEPGEAILHFTYMNDGVENFWALYQCTYE